MKKILISVFASAVVCVLALAGWVFLALSGLPDVAVLKHYRPAAAAEVFDRDGKSLTAYFDRKFRIWAAISTLPDHVIQAVITAEDDTFFNHQGVNYKATWDALVHDVQKRRFARGGSTITQQMIKNVLLSREKTLTRKLREYMLARQAEEVLTKRQILQIYLNEVEWGENIYGIEAASRYYLDKHASELSVAEAALLAGMLPNPRYYDPFKRPEKTKERQRRVLANMHQAKLISPEEYAAGLRAELDLRSQHSGRFTIPVLNAEGRPCYQQVLERILGRLYGEQNLYRAGLTIQVSLEKQLQEHVADLEVAPGNTDAEGRVTAVVHDGQIRAMICTAENEDVVREKLPSTGFFSGTDYEVVTLSLESITRDLIVPIPADFTKTGSQSGRQAVEK